MLDIAGEDELPSTPTGSPAFPENMKRLGFT